MLLQLKRELLLKPLLLTAGFVEKKQTMPILANVYFKKIGNNITIIANDMEIQVSITVAGDMSGEDFIITLPGKKLQDVLKSFPDNSFITFERQASRISISSGKINFTIQSLPADHYPLLKITDDLLSSFSINQTDLKTLIAHVQYAMTDKDSRIFLNGMLFEIKQNQLHLVATDANRLNFINYNFLENLAIAEHSVIIPRKSILELQRLLDDSNTNITVKIFPQQVAFVTDNKEFITKVIDWKYPDYERVIPLNNNQICLIDREELLKALDRVAVIGIDKLKTIIVKLQPNILQMSCRNEEMEESQDEITVEYNDTPLTISFNLAYLRELLINTPYPKLQFAFFNAQRSILVTIPDNDDFKAVLMPLRN